jgi:hypothetical protein
MVTAVERALPESSAHVAGGRSGENMRFMLCARNRTSGAMAFVCEWSFPTRREAIEAVSGVRDFSEFAGSDIFLVDLETATPVAVVPWKPEDESTIEASAPVPAPTVAPAAPVPDDEEIHVPAPETVSSVPDDDEGSREAELAGPAVTLGMVEIDISAWSCEDCIYISTCAKSGTIRPAECGSFQWRA